MKRLVNTFESGEWFDDLEDARNYYLPSVDAQEETLSEDDYIGDDYAAFSERYRAYVSDIARSDSMIELADALNRYSGDFCNGNWEVKEYPGTRKEMRMYEVKRSTKTLRNALKGKDLTGYTRILAEMALEDTEPDPCNVGQKGDIYVYESNSLVEISLPAMVEIEVDEEDGEELAEIGYDYPDDVFERRQLWNLAIYLFGVEDWMMDDIATLMDDDIREKVYNELAPCDALDFLNRYCELAPDFEETLQCEFGIRI